MSLRRAYLLVAIYVVRNAVVAECRSSGSKPGVWGVPPSQGPSQAPSSQVPSDTEHHNKKIRKVKRVKRQKRHDSHDPSPTLGTSPLTEDSGPREPTLPESSRKSKLNGTLKEKNKTTTGSDPVRKKTVKWEDTEVDSSQSDIESVGLSETKHKKKRVKRIKKGSKKMSDNIADRIPSAKTKDLNRSNAENSKVKNVKVKKRKVLKSPNDEEVPTSREDPISSVTVIPVKDGDIRTTHVTDSESDFKKEPKIHSRKVKRRKTRRKEPDTQDTQLNKLATQQTPTEKSMRCADSESSTDTLDTKIISSKVVSNDSPMCSIANKTDGASSMSINATRDSKTSADQSYSDDNGDYLGLYSDSHSDGSDSVNQQHATTSVLTSNATVDDDDDDDDVVVVDTASTEKLIVSDETDPDVKNSKSNHVVDSTFNDTINVNQTQELIHNSEFFEGMEEANETEKLNISTVKHSIVVDDVGDEKEIESNALDESKKDEDSNRVDIDIDVCQKDPQIVLDQDMSLDRKKEVEGLNDATKKVDGTHVSNINSESSGSSDHRYTDDTGEGKKEHIVEVMSRKTEEHAAGNGDNEISGTNYDITSSPTTSANKKELDENESETDDGSDSHRDTKTDMFSSVTDSAIKNDSDSDDDTEDSSEEIHQKVSNSEASGVKYNEKVTTIPLISDGWNETLNSSAESDVIVELVGSATKYRRYLLHGY